MEIRKKIILNKLSHNIVKKSRQHIKLNPFISEYIVSFNNYYSERARGNFINAALNDSGVTSWEILPRHNVLRSQPNDFDVIRVSTLVNSLPLLIC